VGSSVRLGLSQGPFAAAILLVLAAIVPRGGCMASDVRDLGEQTVEDERQSGVTFDLLGDTSTYVRAPTAIEVAQSRVSDTDAAECLHKGLSDASWLCGTKTTQAACEGADRDWYCDPSAGQQCEGSECRVVVVSGFDITQSAYCCTWDGSACTFNTTRGAYNFCEGTYDECSDDSGTFWNTTTESDQTGLYTGGKTCAELTTDELLCSRNATWANETICRFSCYFTGKGYTGDRCAVD